ncbi:MAG: M20 family metallopeptidase [Bacillota bacterium]|nr:M20 family metallopeptidase [Bacillota bacterium]
MTLNNKLKEARRKLHMVAETGFLVHETRELIKQLLTGEGIMPHELAGGLVAETGEGTPCILLRADMDALPVTDGKDVPYKSLHQGACHACGHDAHMAMLHGAALLLKEELLPGKVRFMFQPAEETPPGGALGMIEAGALNGIHMAFAMHLAPWLPFGTVGIKEDTVMAAADNFTLTIRGRGGHGAMPHQGVDAILAASHTVTALQALVSRMTDPLDPLVLTVGKISGGTACNVIADSVILEGTARSLNPQLRSSLPELIKKTAAHVSAAFGAECELDYKFGYPILKNWDTGVNVATEAAAKVVGEDKIVRMDRPLMGGEDFAYILEQVPGAFIFLGTGDEQYPHPLHHPCFDFNEKILQVGAKLFRELAKSALNR